MNQKAYLRMRSLERGLSRFKGRQLEGMVQLRIAREGWMERIINDRFDRESTRAYGGRKWTDRKKDYPWPILQKLGWLQRAAEQAVFGTYRMRGITRWDIGRIACNYAKFHQGGTDTIPARPFFYNPDKRELKPADRRAINLIAAEIRKALRK